MKERPIIFNDEMVRAILDGRKTQTRRLVPEWQLPSETKPEPGDYPDQRWMAVAQRDRRWGFGVFGSTEDECASQLTWSLCPFGGRDDRLWVRETTEVDEETADILCLSRYSADKAPVLYSGDPADPYTGSIAHWNYPRPVRPSIHMPRSACRIMLEISGARVERLNDISEEDAIAEGVPPAGRLAQGSYLTPKGDFATAKVAFQRLWESIYGEESWCSNPWVWVIEFKRVEGGKA
jgi:hypothetical protein